MLRLTNSVAALALIAAVAAAPAPSPAQDQPAAEDLESLVDSMSTDDPAAADEAELPEAELLTDDELDELVAPVALYPDALLAQVLVASTFPLQVVKADRIVAASADMTDDELSATLSEQEFDPSVLVLLSGFPTVIQRMAEDLDWTEQLGIAMLQQDDDVLAAVQRMRLDAREMGYLGSNDAQIVEEDDGQIYIAPAEPEVVYVPTYDPSVVYTSPAPADPYYVAPATGSSPITAQGLLLGGVIGYGSALLVDELWGDDDDDDDDDDWEGYWRRPRPIAWDDREFYPRPYWNRDRPEQARAWSWERDREWRRADDRWRREATRDRHAAARDRQQALGAMGHDPHRIRAARQSGPWHQVEDREQRQDAVSRAERERRQQARHRQDQQEQAERAEQRRKQATAEQRREAEEREDRARAKRESEARKRAQAETDQRAKDQQKQRAKAEQQEQRARAEQQEQRAKAQQQEKAEAKRRAQQQSGQGAQSGNDAKRQADGNRDNQASQTDGKGNKAKPRCRDDDKDCK